MTVDLRVGRPSGIISEPVAHILIFDDVVEGELNLTVFEDFEHGLGESAFGLAGGTFDEDNHRRLVEDAFDFRMPDLFLLLENQSMGLGLLCQGVKDDAHVVGFELFYFFLIGLSEEYCRSILNFVFFEGLWAFLSSYDEIFDIFELPEERYGGEQVIFKLH